MANDNRETPKPTWRSKGGSSSRSGSNPPASKKSRHEWTRRREPKVAGGARRGGSRKFRIAAGLMAFLACVAGLVVLVLLIQPPPPAALILVGADYASNLSIPHNVGGAEGLRGLESLTGVAPRLSFFSAAPLRLLRKQAPLEGVGEWNALIADLSKDRSIKRTESLIFVLALHGLTDEEGAYLLPNRAARAEDRLPLRDVIKAMGELPPGNPKLLVLEPSQVASDWTRGMLHNDFVKRLKELGPEIAQVKNLYVMCAADVDQRCWPSEGLGRTPFFHYLIEGLRGRAAGDDSRLTLDELYAYVRANVASWVSGARSAVQEPILLPAGAGANGVVDSAKRVYLASSRAAEAPESPPEPGRSGLERAWTTYRELNALVPSPSAYSPARWRDYKALLVRHEELARAGAAAQADSVAEQLGGLERVLRKERRITLPASGENSLAMNAAQGGRVEDPSPLAEFNKLWTADTDEELSKLWREIGAKPGAGGEDRLASARSRADGFLLSRFAEAPARNLAAASRRLRLTRGPDFPQPAEAHFLRMVEKYVGLKTLSPADWALVGQAMALRRHAEVAALGAAGAEELNPASEYSLLWNQAIVDAADEQRRRGEDLLFAAGGQAKADAKRSFGQAQERYLSADLRASAVREAVSTRDHVFSELPDYSRWAARRPGAEPRDELVERTDALWRKSHALAALIEAAKAEPQALSSAAREVASEFNALAERFASQRAEIDLKRLGEDWEAATTAARVAFDDAENLALRRTIWDRLENIRKKDREIAARSDTASPSAAEREAAAERLRARSSIEGRLALAALGQSWCDAPRFQGKARFDALADQVGKPGAAWDEAAASVGAEIGARWRALAEEAGKPQAGGEGLINLAELRPGLVAATSASRLAPVGASATPDAFREPAARLRDLRVHDLLIWLANRAWKDHWHDEDPDERPYYQSAVTRFLDDAETLVPGGDQVGAARKALMAPGRLAFDEPKPRVLTSELSMGLVYNLVETGSLPPGTPVVRASSDPRLSVDAAGLVYRALPRREGNAPAQAADFTVNSPLVPLAEQDPKLDRPDRQEAFVTAEGFFRGQIFRRKTPVVIDPVPTLIVSGPAPTPLEASIAVRADPSVIERFGQGNGAIAVVLDCSGSMRGEKFEEAKKALAAVLQNLPRGTRLSIHVFGQAAEGFVEASPRPGDFQDKEQSERTIKLLRAAAPWDPNQLDALVTQFNRLVPFHGTPLVQAMWAAKLELDRSNGMKTLVVLTDGEDTRFDSNRAFNPNGIDIPAFMRTFFKNSNVYINMVFFKTVGEELKKAKQQFAAVLPQLEPPGQFLTVDDFARLVAALENAVRQALVCQLIKGDDGRVLREINVTAPGEADRWTTEGLAPGGYSLRVMAGRAHSRSINLERGDRLIVKLTIKPDGSLGFERSLYGEDERRPREPVGESAGWRLSVLANRTATQSRQLDVMTALEALNPASDPRFARGALKQVAPGFVWHGLEPAEGQGTFQLRARELELYPGPAWRLEVPRWLEDPGGAGPSRPILNVWWLPDGATPSATVEVSDPFGARGLEARDDDGGRVVVESLSVEDHMVRTRPDAPPERVTCLVARLSHPPGQPVIVDPSRLEGIRPERYEHRLYPTSNKTTGLFWPVSRSEVESNLKKMGLIALEPSRRRAEAAKQSLSLRLAQPRTEDRLPEPPAAVLKP